MANVDIGLLRNVPFLKGAKPSVLEGLAEVAVEKHFQPGQVILQEGSTGREMYLIIEGLVEVVKGSGDDEMLLAQRGPGDLFGEMALIEERPRFATIRALEPTRLLQFSEQDLSSVLLRQPRLLYQVMRVLSERLREADLHMISDLQRKNEELARAYRELQAAQAALVEKERLERELELARDLQQSILPHDFPRLPQFSFAARSQPARRVGGDFYDVIPLGKGRLGLVMADVSDKGMASALYMALTRSLIRAEAKRRFSPRQVLLSVHRLLLEMTQADMFVTAFYGVLDPAQHSLRYVRAGHDRPLLFNPATGECRFLMAQGTLLGCLEQVDLEEVDVSLQAGDLLVLYSDGITDANSPAGEFFGVERLSETVCGTGELAAQGVCDLIFESVKRFQAGAVQYDDMALLVVRVDAGV
ncbi:MAG: SpoIIE family protein phosphatase [Chloroflexi bacterium]|nr:SpoIIE family protein phosphatase [Chloroflexota bacterium]